MKNKRAKVSVVFLGVALLFSPLVMLISCKQLHNTPAAGGGVVGGGGG